MLNYPDVFKFITDVEPITIGDTQIAITTRPMIARAGQPFEVILLMQNMNDQPVDFAVSINLPSKDARGQADRFQVKQERFIVGLRDGEAGYIKIPVSTAADTAISADYVASVDIAVKKQAQGEPVRSKEISIPLKAKTLSPEARGQIASLKKLRFSAQQKRGGLLRGSSNNIQVKFGVRSGMGKTTQPPEAAEWVSLWTLDAQLDPSLLVKKHREAIKTRLVPKLKRMNVYQPLFAKTTSHFEDLGYPLTDVEASAITRLLTLILEYGNPHDSTQNILDGGRFNIVQLIEDTPNADAVEAPHWLGALMKAAIHEPRVLKVPIKALPHVAYEALLYDAALHAFFEIERATGEDLGTTEQMEQYSERYLNSEAGQLRFEDVYLPLVLGGVIVYDRVLLPEEKISDVLETIKYMLDDREDELSDDNEFVFKLADRITSQALRKYGALDNRV